MLRHVLLSDWRVVGRPKQQPPEGDWTYLYWRAGRGFGKTISAAQWVRRRALEQPCRVALVAPTIGDVRRSCVEGETGLLSILRPSELAGGSRTAWNRSTIELRLANGSLIEGFSSETPDRIRGPQFHYAWAEEVSTWRDAHRGDSEGTTWSNVKLATRLGDRPQLVITSTPKPNKLTQLLSGLPPPAMRLVIGSSYENRENLSEAWWQEVVAPYEGSRIGRQEIHAEILEDVEGALWTMTTLDETRVHAHPDLVRIVVGVDPNVSSSEGANEAGIIVAGRERPPRSHGYVLADRTTGHGGPAVWAQAAVDAYREFRADLIVAEKNNGGEMVEMVIKTVDPDVPVKLVSASRGKRPRAEPIASLYTGSRAPDGTVVVPPSVHHVGVHELLEAQLTTWTPEADSPDRMDACLVAGTLVTTERGDVPIESVGIGDRVLTRVGRRPVTRAGLTREDAETLTVAFTNGAILRGTPDHPVWVEGDGFRPMGSLAGGDSCLARDVAHGRHTTVERNYESGTAPVYNLEVAGQPEFFANGVLVHNCVWALSELMLRRPAQPARSYVPAGRLPVAADRARQAGY